MVLCRCDYRRRRHSIHNLHLIYICFVHNVDDATRCIFIARALHPNDGGGGSITFSFLKWHNTQQFFPAAVVVGVVGNHTIVCDWETRDVPTNSVESVDAAGWRMEWSRTRWIERRRRRQPATIFIFNNRFSSTNIILRLTLVVVVGVDAHSWRTCNNHASRSVGRSVIPSHSCTCSL